MADISFFSETDMNKGKISSEYPAWYFNTMIDDLKEDIRREEWNLEQNIVPRDQLPVIRDRVKRLKAKLDAVEAARPKFSDLDKNKLTKTMKELGKEITSKMFTRSEMKKGLADSHMEAKRMTYPSISVTPDIAEVAKMCNVPIVGGKLSRKSAEKCWKILANYHGEPSNTEYLRRD